MKHYLQSVFLLLLLLATATAGCIREIDTEGVSGSSDPEVTFTFELPAQAKPTTRVAATVNENQIDNIYVLAFDKDSKFSYYRPVTTINDVDNGDNTKPKKTFKVSLIKSTGSADTYSFVLIANVEGKTQTQIETLSKGTAMATALEGLTYTQTTNVVPAIPMASLPIGPVEINSSTATTPLSEFTDIPLTRMAARIDVQLSSTAKDEYIITELHLFNYNTRGWVYAPTETYDENGYVKTPTITEGESEEEKRGYLSGEGNFISASIDETEDKDKIYNKLYTFEAWNTNIEEESNNNSCIVFKLEKKDDASWAYYYKAVFEQTTDGATSKLDVLRNHRYLFDISKVHNTGFERKEDAYNSVVAGIDVNLIPWTDVELPVVGTDGTYILAVSQMEYEFTKEAVQTVDANDLESILKVWTNHASGWTATIECEDCSGNKITDPADNWLTLSPPSGLYDTKTDVFLKRTENDDATSRSRKAIVYITAGKIKIQINALQSGEPASTLGIELLDGNNAAVTELVFVSKVGIAPTSQTLTVNWQPKDADLTVTNTPIGTNAFPSGVGEPTSNVLGGNGGTGIITYTIQPEAFTADELDESKGGNPFLEKVSKVDFTTTNGVSNVSATVSLCQKSYNLLTDVKNGYMLNSQEETLNVRANFEWKITKVTDQDYILKDNGISLLNKTGGNNTTTGDAVTFTMVAEDELNSKSGKTATITFTNQVDGSTWEVVITAIEDLYVGYFGGELIEIEPGVWRFEYPLYTQKTDESTGIQWSTDYIEGVTNKIANKWDGKGNTYTMKSNSIYSASNLCFNKNGNYETITGIADVNYIWYLPAQDQLMAIWVVHNSFDSAFKFYPTLYWSATVSWYMMFDSGYTFSDLWWESHRVRCVRNVN